MRKIGMLNAKDKLFEVFYDDKVSVNPYRLYEKHWNCGWHKKQLAMYGNLSSCMAYIYTYVLNNDEERRTA